MKIRTVFAFLGICIVFAGCSSKEINELKNRTALLEEENHELKIQNEKIAVLEEENNNLKKEVEELKASLKELGSLNQKSKISLDKVLNDSGKYVVHNLDYEIDFSYDGFDTKVYEAPKAENPVYVIQKNDRIYISKVVYVIASGKNFIGVKVNDDFYGFVEISGNPYSNGNFEVSGSVTVDGKNVTILKMESGFNVNQGAVIKELPCESSNDLYKTSKWESMVQSTDITSDYQWVKIKIKDYWGWVRAKQLDAGRGGPTLNTPEEYIYFDLIGANMI